MTLTTPPEHGRPASREVALAQLEQLFRLDDEDAGELLLIRHALPATGYHGEPPADPLLSCEGLEEAERLAERLHGLWIEAVYTAPERRAFQTARIVADFIDRPLHTIDALAEIGFDPARALPGQAQRFARHPRWESVPGFASGTVFRRRILQAVDSLLAAHPARRIAVVTHSTAINAYLSLLLAVPRDLFFAPDHASISIVRHQRDNYAVRSLNDTAHLAGGALLDGAMPALTARSLPLTNR
jgi:probable phosphoglycerate mutase